MRFASRPFSCKFSREIAPVTCPCPFRLHRLAQAPNVHVHFDCAGWHKTRVRRFSCKFSRKLALVEILLNSSLRGPCMILYRSLTEDLVEILVRRSSLKGPCMRSLQMPCLRGACMKALVGGSWEVLVSRSCKNRSSSRRSFFGGLVKFS